MVGTIALAISFLGCCGAIRESFQLLYAYSIVLIILFLVEVIAAGVVIAFRNDIEHEAIKGIKDLMANYSNNTADAQVIDDLQSSLKCCGAENVTDWHDVPPYNKVPFFYPESCCNTTLENTTHICVLPYSTPCWEAIEHKIDDSSSTLAGFSIAIAVVQFLAMVSACVLAKAYKREYDVV